MKHLRKYNESVFTTTQEIIEVLKLNLEDNGLFEVEEIKDLSDAYFRGIKIRITENFTGNDEIRNLSIDDNGKLITNWKDYMYNNGHTKYDIVRKKVEEINKNILGKISKKYDIEIDDIEVFSKYHILTYQQETIEYRVAFYIPEQTNFRRRIRTRGMSR